MPRPSLVSKTGHAEGSR